MKVLHWALVSLCVLTLAACDGGSDDDGTLINPPVRMTPDQEPSTDSMLPTDEVNTPEPEEAPQIAFSRQALDDSADGPAFTHIADVDGDDRLDLVVSRFGSVADGVIRPGGITVYYQGSSLDSWRQEEITLPSEPVYWPNSTEIVDIDGDGDMDITVGTGFLICEILDTITPNGDRLPPAPCGGLFWYEQTASGWVRHEVVSPGSELFYHQGLITDVDGDGFVDMVTVGERRQLVNGVVVDEAEVQWFRGAATASRFEAQPRVIGPGLGSLASLADIDQDGDLDLISAEYFADFETHSFAWYERVSGPDAANPAGVWTRHVIDDAVGPAIQIKLVPDLFGDGEIGAVGSNHTRTSGEDADPWESAVYAYRIPADPRERWARTQLSNNIVSRPIANQAAPGIFDVGDVDGDGDHDILVSGDGDTRVFLLAQTESGQFDTWVFDEDLPQAGSINIRDLDGDGDMELVASSFDENVIYLYQATEGGAHPLRPAGIPSWASIAGGQLRVNYTGSETGPLVVAIFPSWPPMGPPTAFELVDSPSYPVQLDFPDVDDGDYVALAFIDVDGSGPMAPSDADVQITQDVSFPTNGVVDINLAGEGGPQPAPNPGNFLDIQYGGSEMGPLVVAIFTSWPPTGPPAAFEQIPAPSFPERLEFPTVAPGDYVALAFIDVDGSGPMAPTADDVQARVDITFPAQSPIVVPLGGGAPAVEGIETIRDQVNRNGRVTPVVAYVPEGNGQLPLLLFTPGFQIESAAYANMLQNLASEGFIVARLDPPGSIFDVDHIQMAADVRAGLDWAVNASPFAARVDAARVGTLGHSLGGKVALMNAIEEPRVRAVFAIDPVDGDPSPFPNLATRPNLAPGPVGGINVPIGLVGETTNGISDNAFAPACAPLEENFQTIFDAATGSDWVVEWNIIGADHMDFVEDCPEGPFSPCALCPDGNLAPERVQEITYGLMVAFFEFHLGQPNGMESRLVGDGVPAEVQVRRR